MTKIKHTSTANKKTHTFRQKNNAANNLSSFKPTPKPNAPYLNLPGTLNITPKDRNQSIKNITRNQQQNLANALVIGQPITTKQPTPPLRKSSKQKRRFLGLDNDHAFDVIYTEPNGKNGSAQFANKTFTCDPNNKNSIIAGFSVVAENIYGRGDEVIYWSEEYLEQLEQDGTLENFKAAFTALGLKIDSFNNQASIKQENQLAIKPTPAITPRADGIAPRDAMGLVNKPSAPMTEPVNRTNIDCRPR